jgi:hypothetical protein
VGGFVLAADHRLTTSSLVVGILEFSRRPLHRGGFVKRLDGAQPDDFVGYFIDIPASASPARAFLAQCGKYRPPALRFELTDRVPSQSSNTYNFSAMSAAVDNPELCLRDSIVRLEVVICRLANAN